MVWCTKVRAGSLEHTKAVLGDGGLVAAFPLAYAVLLCALYAPITARLLALVFRGVAF